MSKRITSPLDGMLEAERIAFLQKYLQRIPTRDASVLGMKYIESMSDGSIGDVLGISGERVKQIHDRAIKHLAAHFAAEG